MIAIGIKFIVGSIIAEHVVVGSGDRKHLDAVVTWTRERIGNRHGAVAAKYLAPLLEGKEPLPGKCDQAGAMTCVMWWKKCEMVS